MADTLQFAVGINALFSGSDQFGKFSQAMSAAQSKMQGLQQAAGNFSKLQKMNTSLEASKQKLDAAQAKVRALREQLKQTPNPTQKMRDEFTRANIDAQKLSESVQRQRKQIGELKTALEAAGVSTKGLAGDQDKLTERLNRVTQAQERLSQAQAKYSGLKEQLSWGNIKGTVLGAMATYKALEAPVKLSADFESAMARVKAVSFSSDDADMSKFDMLKAQALQLGADTKFTATQAANTQENLARAGLTPQQIHDILPSVLAMAASDGMELAQAGDILAGSIRGYGLDPQEGARVADMLAYISSNSQTNVANAGAAFQAISGTGQLMGIEAERMGAYIGVLANRGIQGAEAATAIERSLQALAAPTTEAQKTLQKFGVATKTKGGGLRFIDDIAAELLDKTAKLGSTGQMEAFKDVFGKAYAGTMQKMALGVKSGDMNAMYSGLKNDKQGSAQRMADIRNNTLQGDLTSLSSAWEGFMISVGKPLEDWSRNIIQWLTEGIQKVTAFMNEHKTLADIVVKIAAGFAGYKVLSTAWKYGSLLTQLPFAKLSVIMAEGAAQTAATGKSFSLIGTLASKAWGIIAAHPFIAIGAAVSAAAILIYQNWDTIKEVAAKCWQAVKDFAGEAAQWISGKWQAVSDWWDSWTLADVFAPVSDMALRAFSYLIEPFSRLSSWLSDTFKMPDIFAGLSDMASSALDYIKGLFSAFGDWIMNTIGKLNPFNWDLPEWLGGSKEQRAATRAESAKKMASWDPLSGNLPGFAVGGIITRHAAVQVAENGPEAIIPLTDKSRGTELLMQAAQALGVDIIPEGMKQVSYNALNDERAVSSNSNALSSLVQNTGGNALSSLVCRTRAAMLLALWFRTRAAMLLAHWCRTTLTSKQQV